MAFKSKNGQRSFGNRQQAKAYDERPQTKEAPPKETPADGGEENAGQEHSDMDLHEMVAQHGPAEKVEISHSEGKHTKVSHHGGKEHKSEHGTPQEAHQAGMTAAGVEPEQPQQAMQPAMGGGTMSGIPGM